MAGGRNHGWGSVGPAPAVVVDGRALGHVGDHGLSFLDGIEGVFAITDCRLLSRPEERGVDERILAAHWWTTMPPPALVIGMVAAWNKMSPSEYCVYIGAVPRSANEPKDCEWIADCGARVARDHAIAVLPELVGIEEREGLEYREGK